MNNLKSIHFFFWLFLISGLLANYTWFYFSGDTNALWMTPFLTAAVSAIVILPLNCLSRRTYIRHIYVGIMLLLFVSAIATDWFLLLNFSKIFNQDIVDILAETNKNESYEFIATYFSFSKILLYIAALSILTIACCFLSSLLARYKWINRIGYTMAAIGACLWGICAYNFILYRNGLSIPQCTTVTRGLYSVYILHLETKQIETVEKECRNFIEKNNTLSENSNLIICLVVGESHSAFHTDVYGYDKCTFPMLGKISRDENYGKIFWFTDAVSNSDHTHAAVKSIFSIGETSGTESLLLFPACFKALGYKTMLFDNQYFVNSGVSFLSNKNLSDLLYDFRNDKAMTDEELAAAPAISTDCNQLIVLHLMGSHYTYESRYPHERFSVFSPDDYSPSMKDEYRSISAHYDNSLLYTDFVLSSLIDRLKDENAAVIYISDHGEEIYEQGDYMGHGNAASTPVLDYQIRIPMFIWTSAGYASRFPEMSSRITAGTNKPCMSNDIGHVLLDLAHEKADFYDCTRSVVNDSYEIPKRIVLHSIDFDSAKKYSLNATASEQPVM